MDEADIDYKKMQERIDEGREAMNVDFWLLSSSFLLHSILFFLF